MTNYNTNRLPVLVGHPFAPIGRGEDIRCSFRAFRAVGHTLKIRDIYSVRTNPPDLHLEKEFSPHLVRQLGSSVNIFYINGDEVEQALRHLDGDMPSGAYNIICPQWELSLYPKEWAEQLDRFDEVWAPSKFVFDSLRKAVSKPLFHMPLATEVKLTSFLGRRYFGLPESSYLFLFYFDFRSYIERKNPFAVLEAFERVCAARPKEDIRLVIKLNRPMGPSRWEADFPRFMKAIKQSKCIDKIIIIDKVITDNEVKNLVRCCDCFISLHRSEGYGRGMAEAMFLGKPVIATGYSGNLDFMNEANSLLVPYKLIEVGEEQYPHWEGQVWADPDIDRAVEYMIKLLDDREYGRRLGQVASRYLRTHFGYRATGLRYLNRIEEIQCNRRLREISDNWEKLARYDPLWSILTDPNRKGCWDEGEFFATGEAEVASLMKYFQSKSIQVGREQALDFGCGVGRVTQALAHHFERVVGVDASPTMIELAMRYNKFRDRVVYILNKDPRSPSGMILSISFSAS